MLIDVDKFTVENYIGRKKEKKEKGRFEKNIDTHLKRFFSPTKEGKKKNKQNKIDIEVGLTFQS